MFYISMEAYDQHDLNSAILCVWKEARGDGYMAMKAVAHVIFNRVGAPGFVSPLHDVIYIVNDPENHPLRATLSHQVFYAQAVMGRSHD